MYVLLSYKCKLLYQLKLVNEYVLEEEQKKWLTHVEYSLWLASSYLKDIILTPFEYPPLCLLYCRPLWRHNSNNNGKSKLIYNMTHVVCIRYLSWLQWISIAVKYNSSPVRQKILSTFLNQRNRKGKEMDYL